MGQAALAKTSLADYLELEEKAANRHEYYGGEVYAMAGGTANHAKLCASLIGLLTNGLGIVGKSCSVFSSDMKVYIEAIHAAVYPDVSALCGQEEFLTKKETVLLNPSLVVEVLSPTTMVWDQGPKLEGYKKIPALKEILLIWSDQVFAQCHFRRGSFWASETYYEKEASIHINSLGIVITLAQLYGPLAEKLPWVQAPLDDTELFLTKD